VLSEGVSLDGGWGSSDQGPLNVLDEDSASFRAESGRAGDGEQVAVEVEEALFKPIGWKPGKTSRTSSERNVRSSATVSRPNTTRQSRQYLSTSALCSGRIRMTTMVSPAAEPRSDCGATALERLTELASDKRIKHLALVEVGFVFLSPLSELHQGARLGQHERRSRFEGRLTGSLKVGEPCSSSVFCTTREVMLRGN
jgi:hypothetical protein